MSDTAARIARNAWDAQAHHARCHGHHHAQLVEVIDDVIVGDTWQGDTWPGGDPAVLLGDWCCHTRASHLVLVTADVRTLSAAGPATELVVLVAGIDGSSAVLVGAADGEPTPMTVVGGELFTAMRRALLPTAEQFMAHG
jgi:hypothetical protein